jgi:hypothetical protein
MERPGRKGLEDPMTPVSRTTGTTGRSRRSRWGSKFHNIADARVRPPRESLPVIGSAIKCT